MIKKIFFNIVFLTIILFVSCKKNIVINNNDILTLELQQKIFETNLKTEEYNNKIIPSEVDCFGIWIRNTSETNTQKLTISESNIRFDLSIENGMFFELGSCNWILAINDNPETKNDYPIVYTIIGTIIDSFDYHLSIGRQYSLGITMDLILFLHNDKQNICLGNIDTQFFFIKNN